MLYFPLLILVANCHKAHTLIYTTVIIRSSQVTASLKHKGVCVFRGVQRHGQFVDQRFYYSFCTIYISYHKQSCIHTYIVIYIYTIICFSVLFSARTACYSFHLEQIPITLGECVRLSAFRKSSLISTLTRLQQWLYFRCQIPCLTEASYNEI